MIDLMCMPGLQADLIAFLYDNGSFLEWIKLSESILYNKENVADGKDR